MNNLNYIKIKHPKYKYKLISPFKYKTDLITTTCNTHYTKLKKTGEIYINNEYAWDGGSFIAIDNKPMMYASLIHDSLYQLIREGYMSYKFKKIADIIFKEALINYGSSKIRATWCYLAVKYFGFTALTNRKLINLT